MTERDLDDLLLEDDQQNDMDNDMMFFSLEKESRSKQVSNND